MIVTFLWQNKKGYFHSESHFMVQWLWPVYSSRLVQLRDKNNANHLTDKNKKKSRTDTDFSIFIFLPREVLHVNGVSGTKTRTFTGGCACFGK